MNIQDTSCMIQEQDKTKPYVYGPYKNQKTFVWEKIPYIKQLENNDNVEKKKLVQMIGVNIHFL